MSAQFPFNPHATGLIMKEVVRRAMIEIRCQRMNFTSKTKDVDYKDGADLVTSADTAAQEIYVRTLRECFPYAGIIAEEDFKRACDDPNAAEVGNYFFTIDPLDGTKAFGRRQSHGVSTMLSLVHNDEIIAATIGDPNTLEIYHTRPGSKTVHRIFDFKDSGPLAIDESRLLSDQYLLTREAPSSHSAMIEALCKKHGVFRDVEVMGGSIGTAFARLWKGEVGGIALPQTPAQTAWDACPVIGISRKLGFEFFKIEDGQVSSFNYVPVEKLPTPFEIICVHQSRAAELINGLLPQGN